MLNTNQEKAINILHQWINAVNALDVETLVGLYADDATLLPTFSKKIAASAQDLTAYFNMLGSRPGASVELDEASIVPSAVGDNAVCLAGYYTFFFVENDQRVAYPSRFTFVIVVDADRPISHQHSSELPSK